MPRRLAPREPDALTGAPRLRTIDRDKLDQELYAEHNAILRNAQEMRRLVLLGDASHQQTRLTGGESPLLQLALIARDSYQSEEDPHVKQGYFREMRNLVQSNAESVLKTIVQLADLEQRDRHHREKLALLREKITGEPTEAELEQAANA